METEKLQEWLPTTRKEMELRGWDEADVILFSGDAYVDHPSFGAAVIGRVLESAGLRVAIVPQPNWRDDLRDFRKLGRPRLFFGVSAGAMDSMVNRYTANRRTRSEDAYTPDGRTDMRPDYPTIVYTRILKQLYPDVPVVAGGIEASLRRLAHYDYWEERLRPSILADCGADLLIYGMGEEPVRALAARMQSGEPIESITNLPQTALLRPLSELPKNAEKTETDRVLASFESCLKNPKLQAENFRRIEEESNCLDAKRLWQQTGDRCVRVNPPFPPMDEAAIDAVYELPYTYRPHPKYREKRIPAYDMIRFSVNIHRGCFGGCAFCTISAHQGKTIVSRSLDSVLREVRRMTGMPEFKGYISDLGGPSANMYKMGGRNRSLCRSCRKPSCLHPEVCPNLDTDHAPLLELYRAVDALPGVKKSFVGSGVRYDLLLHRQADETVNRQNRTYAEELICRHVSGRLKVAPEHTADRVLQLMRKPSFRRFGEFKQLFDRLNDERQLRQQLIPYFISSHPGCGEEDMAELAAVTKGLNFHLEQVQDFTPTPMTLATEIYYTGIHPYTKEPVFCARTPEEKLAQRAFFFWYHPDHRKEVQERLRRMGRNDLLQKLYENTGSRPTSKKTTGQSFPKQAPTGTKPKRRR